MHSLTYILIFHISFFTSLYSSYISLISLPFFHFSLCGTFWVAVTLWHRRAEWHAKVTPHMVNFFFFFLWPLRAVLGGGPLLASRCEGHPTTPIFPIYNLDFRSVFQRVLMLFHFLIVYFLFLSQVGNARGLWVATGSSSHGPLTSSPTFVEAGLGSPVNCLIYQPGLTPIWNFWF